MCQDGLLAYDFSGIGLSEMEGYTLKSSSATLLADSKGATEVTNRRNDGDGG